MVLQKQMRQDDDPEFARLLSDCRRTKLSESSANLLLYELNNKKIPDDVMRLYATRAETAEWNSKKLNQLPGQAVMGLKVGAPVMVTKNFYVNRKLELVNGDTGTVKELGSAHALVFVRGKLHRLRHPLPLTLAYALTIHKSQGQTYDRVAVVGSKIFAPGQLYTALSRVKSLDGLYCKDVLPEHAEIPHAKSVTEFIEQLSLQKLP